MGTYVRSLIGRAAETVAVRRRRFVSPAGVAATPHLSAAARAAPIQYGTAAAARSLLPVDRFWISHEQDTQWKSVANRRPGIER